MKVSLIILFTIAVFMLPITSFGQQFIRGDLDGDGDVDVDDLCILQCVSFGACSITGADCASVSLVCELAADINDNGLAGGEFSDVLYLYNFVNGTGPAPPPPYPDCGEDPTDPQPGEDCCGGGGNCCQQSAWS